MSFPRDRVVAFGLLLLSCLNLAYIYQILKNSPGQSRVADYSYIGHDYPTTLPLSGGTPGSVLMTVEETVQYPLAGFASDSQWSSLATDSAGYVRLGPRHRIFVVTMFHEMHCLRILNLAFDPSNIVGTGHINHCLGYLRQMAMCGSDVTLEPANWEERDFKFDRVGATHVCRDWTKVYAEVETNYQRWNSGRKFSGV